MTAPLTDWLGLRINIVDGETIYSLEMSEEHIGNPLIRALHGGVVATFIEYVALRELERTKKGNKTFEAININVDFLRSAKAEGLHAKAKITKTGRRLTIVDITAWQTNSHKPVAKASCSFLVVPA